MTPKLTNDQRQAIEKHGGKPVYLVDADTNTNYVLRRADQFVRVRAVFEGHGELDPRQAYPLIDKVVREDDERDPALAHYQQYTRKEA